MMWTFAGMLFAIWLFGLVSGTTMGGLIHVLLVIAIMAVGLNFIQSQREL
jgi:hypothetical protein